MRKYFPNLDDPQELAKVAELDLEGWSREEIAAEMSRKHNRGKVVDPSYVSQWLKEARDRHITAVDIDPSFGMVGEENSVRSAELMTKFKIEEVLVIDPGSDVAQDPKAADLHTTLGNRTGMAFCRAPSTNTRLFVAGGRTVIQIARMIKRLQAQRRDSRDNRVDPLSGRSWTAGRWQVDGPDDLQRPLDADDAAVILASAYPKSGTHFSQIGRPLYAGNPEKAERFMRANCAFLPSGEWNWVADHHETYLAICGIGVLHPDSGHRIMGIVERYYNDHNVGLGEFKSMFQSGVFVQKLDGSDAYRSGVAATLIESFRFAKKHGLGDIADVGNRLFPSLPLPDELRAGPQSLPRVEDFRGLVDRLDALNRRAIVMKWPHLRKASTWITAGGRLKFRPLWTLAIVRYIEEQRREVQGRKERVSVMNKLTTDLTTANELLAAFESYEKAPAAIKKWYEDLSGVLFQPDGRAATARIAS